MPKFEFISDASFRAALDSDYAELDVCLRSNAHKAVHVLAGSIVEAILVDYLIATDHQKRTGVDPLKMQLADLISACRSEKVLSDRAAELSSVIKGYRNLIHPGRVVRLKEKIDQNTATIAKALVDVVIEEVIAGKREAYGYTAEQLVAKVEKDPSAVAILEHLLKDTRECERKRLLLEVLPHSYLMPKNDLLYPYPVGQMQATFRIVYRSASDAIKTQVAKRFVTILKEESEKYVHDYEEAFFSMDYLRLLSAEQQDLIKAHLISRLREQTAEVLDLHQGIGVYLATETEIRTFLYRMTSLIMKASDLSPLANTLLYNTYSEASEKVRGSMMSQLSKYTSMLSKYGKQKDAEILNKIIADWKANILF